MASIAAIAQQRVEQNQVIESRAAALADSLGIAPLILPKVNKHMETYNTDYLAVLSNFMLDALEAIAQRDNAAVAPAEKTVKPRAKTSQTG